MFKRLHLLYKKIFRFVSHDVWHVGHETLSKRDAFLVRQLKILLITIKEFNQNKVNQQASSLTLYTLLSIVPIAALFFAVAKGFGIDYQLTTWIDNAFQEQQEIVKWIRNFAESTIQNARGGWIAGIGLVILLWTSLNMFVQIETSFNDIWQTKHSRSWFRRFADYLSIMLIVPILLLMSSSVTVSLKYYLDSIDEYIPLINISPIVFTLLPYLLVWALFTILYIVMPTVKVKFIPALIAGIIAGTAFQLIEQFYFYSQVTLSRYNFIYGSLAAIPLFLICTKIAWQIVLMGAELSFSYQNIDSYELEIHTNSLSQYNIKLLSLYILQHIVNNFEKGKPQESATQLAHNLSVSVRAVRIILDKLVQCKILVETFSSNEKERAYLPAIDIRNLTVGFVIARLDNLGSGLPAHDISTEMERISFLLDRISKQINEKDGNLKLSEI